MNLLNVILLLFIKICTKDVPIVSAYLFNGGLWIFSLFLNGSKDNQQRLQVPIKEFKMFPNETRIEYLLTLEEGLVTKIDLTEHLQGEAFRVAVTENEHFIHQKTYPKGSNLISFLN